MTKVKICGITQLSDALAACDCGADALGFVMAPEARKRGRYIELDAAAEIVRRLPPFVATVGVCVNDPPERIARYLEVFDLVQLHGEETPEQVAFPGRSIKVFRAGPDFDVATMDAYPARAYLLDACSERGRGGTGERCDWSVARDAVQQTARPVILAGGLTPENVAEAVRAVRPYAVDTSGGVEGAPGKKDHDRLRAFLDNAKTPLA